jgi:hypothetical protein
VRRAGSALSSVEVAAGWRLQQVDARTQDDVNATASAYEHAVLRAALEAGVAPKGTEEVFAAEAALGAPVGRGAVRSYAKRALGLALDPPGAQQLEGESEDGEGVQVVTAAALSAKKRDEKTTPSIYYLRKVTLREDDAATQKKKKAAAKRLEELAKKAKKSKKEAEEEAKCRDLLTDKGAAPHGQAKRTWEVIRDVGVASYDVRKNPLYAAAFMVAREGEGDPAGAAQSADEELDQGALAVAEQAGSAGSPSRKKLAATGEDGFPEATPSKVDVDSGAKKKKKKKVGAKVGDGEAGGVA